MSDMMFLDGTSYTRLIENVDANLVTFKDIINNNYDKNRRSFCIRHDVDNAMLQNSLNFAKIERHRNWPATYFIKYTSDYFDFSQRFVDSCQLLVDLGHDLALHVDIIQLYMDLKRKHGKVDLLEVLEKPLNFLRNQGFEILGAAAHGSPENYIYALNYEFWKEFDSTKNEATGNLNFDKKISLKELGLLYEAYFLKYNYYITDSMGKWTGTNIDKREVVPYENSMIFGADNMGKAAFKEFEQRDKGMLQILIHPSKRWRISRY